MCDKCGSIFSEKDEGWSTMTGTRYVTNSETGKRVQISDDMDMCGACNTDLMERPRMIPQAPIPAS
jgi:hypothetical protein